MKQWLWDHARSLMGIWFATLLAKAAGIFTRVLSALGLGWVAMAWVMPQVKEAIAPYFSAVPSWAVELVAATNIDRAATLILSALAVRFSSALVFARSAAWQSH